jgi:hypothetical protein
MIIIGTVEKIETTSTIETETTNMIATETTIGIGTMGTITTANRRMAHVGERAKRFDGITWNTDFLMKEIGSVYAGNNGTGGGNRNIHAYWYVALSSGRLDSFAG